MSLNRDLLTPEKIKELLTDPTSWLFKQKANDEMAEVDYLMLVKKIVALEIAKTNAKALELENKELEAKAVRSAQERESFNAQFETFANESRKLEKLASSLAHSNTPTLAEICQKIADQAEKIRVMQQQSYTRDVVNTLTQSLTFPNGDPIAISPAVATQIAQASMAIPSQLQVEQRIRKMDPQHPLLVNINQLEQTYHENRGINSDTSTLENKLEANLLARQKLNYSSKQIERLTIHIANILVEDMMAQVEQGLINLQTKFKSPTASRTTAQLHFNRATSCCLVSPELQSVVARMLEDDIISHTFTNELPHVSSGVTPLGNLKHLLSSRGYSEADVLFEAILNQPNTNVNRNSFRR